ncbi:MAG: RNA pyrophosphohydrolase [Pseudomonadota bacterium]
MLYSKEYRLGVGIMIVNSKNEVFLGNRSNSYNNYTMPQGGILQYEVPYKAMCRELQEEVGIKMIQHCSFIARSRYWYTYNFPSNFKYMLKYKGQMQQWFLIRFHGNDSDINLNKNIPQEFYSYLWTSDIIGLVSKVKRSLYSSIYNEFSTYL